MSKKNLIFAMIISSVSGGVIALGGYNLIYPNQTDEVVPTSQINSTSFTNFSFDTSSYVVPEGLNFVYAAKTSTSAVVHIRTRLDPNQTRKGSPMDDFFREYFGDENPRRAPRGGAGSGVIVSSNGYIVTNNHVVDGATEIHVLLNDNRTYEAEIVGVDPTTDLAVLKIDDQNLPQLKWGNSDQIQIGEWVLAVGNPFDFRSTVTAGIVSAKARNINILRTRLENDLSIESFIQTDAAVNPGNSGGALVNLNGELVGINTAIISPTGAFAGYSFAVPVSLVKKVYEDLVEFGSVQRALLGIRIISVNAELAEDRDLSVIRGVYISSVGNGTAADDAGLESGDVIVGVNGIEVTSSSELQERVALNRPGDEVTVTYIRNGSTRDVRVTLQNNVGTTEVTRIVDAYSIEGAEFQEVSTDEMELLDIDGGIKFSEVGNGKWRDAGIKPGFVVTKVDKHVVQNIEDFKSYLEDTRGEGILITGYYPNGEKAYYGIAW